MPKYRKKIWSGDVYEIEEYFCPRSIGKNYERGLRENLTSEEQQKRNLQIARKKLTRLINCNFTGTDYFVTLTFGEKEKTIEEVRKALANFFRRVKRYRNKNNIPELKYIAVLEKEPCFHYHLVMNGIEGMKKKDFEKMIYELWGCGFVYAKHLYKNQKDNRLANYITKENIEKNAKRWSQSRNLDKPKIVVEEVKESKKKRKLHVPKNYEEVLYAENYFEDFGWFRYLKAVKKGGMDYGDITEEGAHCET